MAKNVKLADIAEKLDVSVVTISKALSGQKGVSEELREKIVQLADEMGYVQPSVARRRAMHTNFNIGVLIEENYLDRYSSFYWQMYQQVAQQSMDKGCFSLLEVVTPAMEEQMQMPKLLTENKTDGIIVIGWVNEAYVRKLVEEAEVPLVFMDCMDRKQSADTIISDNYYGAYYLTNFLFDMGHENIAYVGTLGATGSITDRYLGYTKSLIEHGKDFRLDWIIDDRDADTGKIDEENKLQLPEEMPTAFFCNCDVTAGMLIKKLQKAGYRVPEDISVVGYDNYIYPGLCDIEITSYEVDYTEMSKRAVETLVRKLNKEYYARGTHIVEGHLVIKDSVRKIN